MAIHVTGLQLVDNFLYVHCRDDRILTCLCVSGDLLVWGVMFIPNGVHHQDKLAELTEHANLLTQLSIHVHLFVTYSLKICTRDAKN